MPDDVSLAQQSRRLTGGLRAALARVWSGVAGVWSGVADRPGPAGPVTGSAWITGLANWDGFYAIVFAGVIAICAVTSTGWHRTLTLAALAAMVPWYLLIGRPYMARTECSSERRAYVYLAGLVVLFAAADLLDPNAWFLAFALCPQCFHILRARAAIWPAVAVNVIGALSIASRERTAAGYATAIGIAAFGIVFARVYSGFVLGLYEQSVAQADLIAQLDQTRSELATVSRSAGMLAERQRLAGEIHDTLAQGFSSILMLIQAADAQLMESPAAAHSQLELAAQTARENLAEARVLVGALAPAQLEPGNLEAALGRIAERAEAELGIRATFETVGSGRQLAAATEVVLLRTGQEAIANVRKHAAARRVTIRLSYAEGCVRLEVCDDGAGFDPGLVSGGYGLRGMRARVAEAGGQVQVSSGPADGTSVLVEVPG
jgi:signal transduction histidine kinase